eukprot:3369940-Rhodomonas_salina.1
MVRPGHAPTIPDHWQLVQGSNHFFYQPSLGHAVTGASWEEKTIGRWRLDCGQCSRNSYPVVADTSQNCNPSVTWPHCRTCPGPAGRCA